MSKRPPIARLSGRMQHNAWGARDAIARLRGEDPAGEPEAELWFGDHVRDPSCVEIEGEPTPIADWLEAWGEDVVGPGRAGLPVLVKILAAAEPLSIQVHPDAATARAGFEREERAGIPVSARERSYRDPHVKLEMLCALGPVEAMCGLRDFEEVVGRLASTGSSKARSLLEGASTTADVFLRTLRLSADEAHDLQDELGTWAEGRAADDRVAFWVRTLLDRHPGDPMAVAPLLMNHVELAEGEALVVSPGTVHAYLVGMGVEVMTPSDNVVRAGLTRSHVDHDEFEQLLDRDPGRAEIVGPASHGADRVRAYGSSIDAFTFARVDLSGAVSDIPLEPGRPGVVLCTHGRIEVHADGDEGAWVELGPTESALVPAARTRFELRGSGTAFLIR